MEKITGNFLTQANRDFPLDCETLDYLQSLAAYGELLGNVVGDKTVVAGCEIEGENKRRKSGYVFLRTQHAPDGEILYWEGGTTVGGMYVKEDSISISANNVDYPKAYTRRSLAPGVGAENYSWDDFSEIKTIKELIAENEKLRNDLASLRPSPPGIVEMWAGIAVPEGYLLCDGQALRTEDYPELFRVLGTTFNTGISATGIKYSTAVGYFRVPDLRGRFVVGQHDSDNDYRTPGSGGGLKKVSLSKDEIPSHDHSFKDYYYPESRINLGSGYANPTNNLTGSGRSDTDNDSCLYYTHQTENTGGGQSHENRPPYYVLAYIMRAK